MSDLRGMLNQRTVLTMELVRQYRNDILHNYPTKTTKERAKMLADKLHNMLDGQLEGLSNDLRTEVRVHLFKNSIRSQVMRITQEDILETISSSDMPDEVFELEVCAWLQTTCQVEDAHIHARNFVQSKRPDYTPDPYSKQFMPKRTLSFDAVAAILRGHLDKTRESLSALYQQTKRELKESKLTGLVVLSLIALTIGGGYIDAETVETIAIPAPPSISFEQGSQYIVQIEERNRVFVDILKYTKRKEKDGIPPYLNFDTFDEAGVKAYLDRRNSMFADGNHLEEVVEVAKLYDVHPLLLLAIIGQEQGFVPRDHKFADKIINNPFNVNISWEKFNTNLYESAEIAAGTVVVVLRKRPAGENPFQWLNTRYAEDPNWWKGVQELFYTLLTHGTPQ